MTMTHKEFEKCVEEGIEAVPERFQKLLINVAIVTQDEPTAEQKKELALREDDVLFGLYEGVPLTEWGRTEGMTLPDKITIFMNATLEAARTKDDVREIVRDTVWHEIAHHFGLDEDRVEEMGKSRDTRLPPSSTS